MKLQRRKRRSYKKIAVLFLFFTSIILSIYWLVFLSLKNKNSDIFLEPLPQQTFLEKLEKQFKEFNLDLVGGLGEEGSTILATASSGTTFLFKKKSDYSLELASLQLILKNIRIEGKWPARVDLRYSRPVIAF